MNMVNIFLLKTTVFSPLLQLESIMHEHQFLERNLIDLKVLLTGVHIHFLEQSHNIFLWCIATSLTKTQGKPAHRHVELSLRHTRNKDFMCSVIAVLQNQTHEHGKGKFFCAFATFIRIC